MTISLIYGTCHTINKKRDSNSSLPRLGLTLALSLISGPERSPRSRQRWIPMRKPTQRGCPLIL